MTGDRRAFPATGEEADLRRAITVVVRIVVAPGAGPAYEKIARELAVAVRENEPGCLLFAVQRMMGQKERYVVVARFASTADLEKHWESDHLRRATRAGYPLAEQAPEVEIFQDI